ncbi:MAG TPA: SDR family NAD(P)-dependent oxidoreductase [Pseudolabrys sp.]|nr:SDR family NAD(P)-dependent oxidoreductase [Pseudolabrys sp.]
MARTVLITGASSGIGRALALRYAAEGGTLGLIGRNLERLEAVAKECRAAGAGVVSAVIDVRDRAEMAKWISAFDRTSPVDLVFANAGVMEGTRPGGDIEPPDLAHALIEINVLGVLNTVQPLMASMMARRRGHIAIVSSLAGFVPLPDAPSYSASKAAVLRYGMSLRALLAERDVKVSVICPGYVTTPMMQRESGVKPFEMAPEKAVEIIRRGLARNKATIVFPFWFGLSTRLSGILPDRLRRWVNGPFRFTVSDPN